MEISTLGAFQDSDKAGFTYLGYNPALNKAEKKNALPTGVLMIP